MYLTPIFISLLGIAAATCWGIADYFAARSSKKSSPETTYLWGSLIGASLYLVYFLFNHGNGSWNVQGVLYSAVAGALFSIGYMTFYRGLVIGPVSIVSPVGSAYPLVTLGFVLLVFKAHLSHMEIAGVLITVFGIILASEVTSKRRKAALSSGFKLALLTLIFWGIAFAFFGRSVNFMGWQKATLIDFWTASIFYILWQGWLEGEKFLKRLRPSHAFSPYILGNGLLLLVGWVVFAYGLSRSHTSAVITAIAATYPALTILLSFKYLGEKKKLIPIIGAVITLAGVVILSV